ncbi:MAG: phage holin family protein [Subdoligranulum variabile]|nr:phage holin family protein [Subdoligranulum variabile]
MLLTPIVLFWYIVSELGSILENAEKMGASIPPLLKNAIEKMRDSDNDKHNTSI